MLQQFSGTANLAESELNGRPADSKYFLRIYFVHLGVPPPVTDRPIMDYKTK